MPSSEAEIHAAMKVAEGILGDRGWGRELVTKILEAAAQVRTTREIAVEASVVALEETEMPDLAVAGIVVLLGRGNYYEARAEDGGFLMATGGWDHFVDSLPDAIKAHRQYVERVNAIRVAAR